MPTGRKNRPQLDQQGDTHPPSSEETRPTGDVPGGGKPFDFRGGRRPLLPQAEPQDLTDAAVYLNSMWCGCTVQRLNVTSRTDRMPELHSRVFNYTRLCGRKPKKVPNPTSETVLEQYGGVLWRGRIGYQKIWTYGDSLEQILIGLCALHRACYGADEDNDARWLEYVDCLATQSHLPLPDTTEEYRTCSRCGTMYFPEPINSEHFCEEINPPHDPAGDIGGTTRTTFYTLDDQKKAHPEVHLVRWATWMAGADRKLLCTRIGPATVTTEFLGYCELPRPLLFETHVCVGESIQPIARHGTLLEATIAHDKGVAELRKGLRNVNSRAAFGSATQ